MKNFTKIKTNAITIAFILMLTIAAFIIVVPTVQSQNSPDPGSKIETWLLVSTAPNPVGVGQICYLNTFLSHPSITETGPWGDRFEGLTIDVTKPDGTKKTFGPFLGDPTGGAWTSFTPVQVGTYTVQAFYPGQILTADSPLFPGETTRYGANLQYIGTEMLPSQSKEVTLVVQEEPVKAQYQQPSLPTDYWSRPIYSTNRDWAALGGSWLGLRASGFAVSGVYDSLGSFMPYTTAPNTGHILWTKPTKFGGQAGAPINADEESQYMSTSITTMCFEPIILNGILYYNEYPEFYLNRNAWVAVDMRTGEEVWRRPCGITGNEYLKCGQIVKFHSIQEYGSVAYLWSVEGTGNSIFGPTGTMTIRLYEPFTGNYICELVNGTQNLAMMADYDCNEQGTILGYYTSGDQLILWNSTKAFAYPLGFNPESGVERNIRPGGRDSKLPPSGSINWSAGIEWSVPRNFSLAGEDTGNLGMGLDTHEVIVLRSAPEPASYVAYNYGYQITVGIDARTGNKLWGPLKQTIPAAHEVDLICGNDGVYVLHDKDTNEAYGYSIQTGLKLWGPVALSGTAWSSIARTATIAYGNVYFYDFGGMVNCLDKDTGEIKWTFTRGSSGYDAPYGIYPIWTYEQSIVDGKLFLAEGSLYNPPLHPTNLLCINATSGELIWDILFYGSRMNSAHADGMFVMWNAFDCQIYGFGKGQTATSVSIQNDVITEGDSVLIKGKVTDESPGTKQSDRVARFPDGVPAIADEQMSPWMEYVYMQQPKPADATGVEVVLSVLDPNNNVYGIGATTSDESGGFKLMFSPDVPGEYTVIATFEGSESYWPSTAYTYLGVEEAPQPTSPPDPTPGPQTETFITGSTIAILAGIAIAIFLLLRKK